MENLESQLGQSKPPEAVFRVAEEGGAASETDEERYRKFAGGRKDLYASLGVDSLREAKQDRNSALSDVESMKRFEELYSGQAEKLREEISQMKANLITRLLEFRRIRELKRELKAAENSQSVAREQSARKAELLGFYDKLVAEQEELSRLMEEALKDNEEFDASKRSELLENEKNRDVKTLAGKHKVFFVHDIVVADWKPSANNRAINTKNLDFEDQLDIVLGLEPTLSVSTLSPDSKNRTFGDYSWGVLMSGGRVVGGQESDAATVAAGLRNRRIEKRFQTIEAIDKAIERPWGGGKKNSESYNELVLEKPEVAGVYFKWNDDLPAFEEGGDIFLLNSEKARYDGWWKRLGQATRSGAPVFVIEQDNNVRLVHGIDLVARSFKVTPKYEPENLIDMPGIYQQHLGKEEKRKAVMRVFDKAAGLIPEEEQEKYRPDGSENDTRTFGNIH